VFVTQSFEIGFWLGCCYILSTFFVFGMAQQIVTLHEKNGGLFKYGNVISNQDAD
jgi:hypothetical protein